jgi:hypothetical protein
MTLEKWIFGFLAVAFAGSILWVFARHRTATPQVPATEVASPALFTPPDVPEEVAAPVPSPSGVRTRTHAVSQGRVGKTTPVRARVARSATAHRRVTVHSHARRHSTKRVPRHDSSRAKARA